LAERENAFIQKINQLKNIYAQLRGDYQNSPEGEKSEENQTPPEAENPENAENQVPPEIEKSDNAENQAPPEAEKSAEIASNPEELKTGDN